MSFGRRQPTGFLGVERRRSVRKKINASALVLLPTLERLTGRVVDVSRHGARLDVMCSRVLPPTFALRVHGRTYPARVVRHGSGHVGVQFI